MTGSNLTRSNCILSPAPCAPASDGGLSNGTGKVPFTIPRKIRKLAAGMSTTNEKYRDDLTAYLLEVATGSGYLRGTLLNTPDLDEAWQRYAPSFYGDAVREFNGYPEYCLACAGYLGMAVAHLWDKDWPKYMDTPYSFFQSDRGFDDMDDYITGSILKDNKLSVAAMHSLSAEAYHFLMKSGAEAGTAEAYRFFLISVEVMYKTGAAIWLNKLGYALFPTSIV